MSDLPGLVERLSTLTVMEAAELSKMLEDKWGVSAAAPSAAPVAQAPVAEQAPEQTEFSVVLTSVPSDKRITVIKEVRTITGLGLKEAKDFTEAAPQTLKESLTKEEAERVRQQIEAAGGIAEIK